MKKILLITSLIALSSCGFLSPVNTEKRIKDSEDAVASARERMEYESAIYVARPSGISNPIVVENIPQWQQTRINLQFSNTPMEYILRSILTGSGMSHQLAKGVESDKLIGIEIDNGTIREALDKLAATTDNFYSVRGETVFWNKYETATFYLPVTPGEYSFTIGKTGGTDGNSGGSNTRSQGGMGGSGSGQSISGSSLDVDRDQFSNSVGKNINPFKDAEDTIKKMVGSSGYVSASESTGSIFVSTTPSRMKIVNDHVNSIIANLSQQVVMDIKLIQLTSSNKQEAGWNWSVAKNSTRSELNFAGESPSGKFADAAPISFSGVRTTGTASVDILLNALDQQGNMSVITEHRIQTRSGRLVEVELAELQGYVAESRTTSMQDVGTINQLVPGIMQGGNTLFAMAQVYGDKVVLNLSSKTAVLSPTETKGTATSFIELPRMKQNRFVLEQMTKSGTTIVAAAIRRETNRSQANSPIRAKILPLYRGNDTVIEDIYLLVTPRVIQI